MLAPASSAGRRLVTALLLAGCAVVLGLLPAQAASPAASPAASQLPDQARKADAVFTGTVTGSTTAARSGGQRSATTTYDVDVKRVYKGAINDASVRVVAEATRDSCRLGRLGRGSDYVFFVAQSGAKLVTDQCRGTAAADSRLVGQVEKLLGEGRAPVPPAPTTATFTKLAHAEPMSFPRLAAPGVALVLVGLLGLVVVRRIARR